VHEVEINIVEAELVEAFLQGGFWVVVTLECLKGIRLGCAAVEA
jgi:hypothetical protein